MDQIPNSYNIYLCPSLFQDSSITNHKQYNIYLQFPQKCSAPLLYYQIMDFIKDHKTVLAAAGAVLTGLGVFLYLSRKDKHKELVSLPFVYDADLSALKSGFTSKMEEIRSTVVGDTVPDELLLSVAQEIADYVERRTREVEREDFYKAREARARNRVGIYIGLIFLWQEEKETQAKQMIEEQQAMLQSFNLNQQQVEQVNQHTQNILRDKVAAAVTPSIIKEAKQLLSLKTDYLKSHGDALFVDIVEASSEKLSLQHLAAVLNVMINEAVYSQHEELLNHQLEISWAIESFSSELDAELAGWDEAVTPLFERIMDRLLQE